MYYNNRLNTGIFWDYENVPLRKRDFNEFLRGMSNFISNNEITYAKVYARKNTITRRDQELINTLETFRYKFVNGYEKNAVDYSMMQSCVDVVRLSCFFNQVLIITGDGDFSDLLDELREWGIKILLIVQRANYNENLINYADRTVSVNFVSQNPNNWWIN